MNPPQNPESQSQGAKLSDSSQPFYQQLSVDYCDPCSLSVVHRNNGMKQFEKKVQFSFISL